MMSENRNRAILEHFYSQMHAYSLGSKTRAGHTNSLNDTHFSFSRLSLYCFVFVFSYCIRFRPPTEDRANATVQEVFVEKTKTALFIVVDYGFRTSRVVHKVVRV